MGLTKLALRFSVTVPELENFSRFLFIGPHPDDIEIGAGATAAKLAAEGKSLCFLICTDGRFGSETLTVPIRPDELAARRRAEAISAAAVLGVRDVRFLDLSDGGFYSMEALEKGIARVIGDFKPEVIFAPDPCVTSECHKDHLNVGSAARTLAEFSPYGDIMAQYGSSPAPVSALAYYMTAKPNLYVNTAGFTALQKESIFGCHLSQFPEGSDGARSLRLYLKLRSIDFGMRRFSKSAEGFRVLSQTAMHCLPEAGN